MRIVLASEAVNSRVRETQPSLNVQMAIRLLLADLLNRVMKTTRFCSKLRHTPLVLRQLALRGYTLVEIMIVVAIIGLLVAIALPNFLKHRNSVRVKACMENLRVLNTAKAQWAMETRQMTAARPVAADLIPYLRDAKLPDCPANGTYRLRSLARNPNCSLWPEGHTLANLDGDDDPDAD